MATFVAEVGGGSPAEARVVVDVNVVVDLALELGGVRTGHHRELEFLLGALGKVSTMEGEPVLLRPVLSHHVLQTGYTVLRRGRSAEEAKVLLHAAAKNLFLRRGVYDATREDYRALAASAQHYLGTDAEDEAVLACAQRSGAAVLTEDREFRQYLGDRGIRCWGLAAFCCVTA
jgi:predicted nucleic acid-binding protein